MGTAFISPEETFLLNTSLWVEVIAAVVVLTFLLLLASVLMLLPSDTT